MALVGQVEGGLSPWRSFRRWVRDVYHLKYTTVKLRFLVYLISRRIGADHHLDGIAAEYGDR